MVILGNDSQNDLQKVLGTISNPHEDTFSFKIQLDDSDANTKKTHPISQPTNLMKRIILSKPGIYDPIGSRAAVLIKATIAMQELWQLGLDWDEDVPPDKKTKWTELFKEMALLNEVKLEQCLTPLDAMNNPWLIIFCDASRLAFGHRLPSDHR